MNKILRDLLNKYPNAEIVPFTSDDIADDCGMYFQGKTKEAYYGKYWEYDGGSYLDKSYLIDDKEIDEDDPEIIEKEGIILLIDII